MIQRNEERMLSVSVNVVVNHLKHGTLPKPDTALAIVFIKIITVEKLQNLNSTIPPENGGFFVL